jgi:hypothetical protein
MVSGEGKRSNEKIGQQSPGIKRSISLGGKVLRKWRDPREGKHEVNRAFISFSYVYVYHACLIVARLLVIASLCQASARKSTGSPSLST